VYEKAKVIRSLVNPVLTHHITNLSSFLSDMSCDGQLMQQLVWWRLLNRNNKECELCLKAETLSPKQRKIASHMAEILLIFLGFDFLFLLYSAINFGSDQLLSFTFP